MKLSVITPYYKTHEQTKKLAEVLIPQLNEQTEWIIIDDGTGDDFSYINSSFVKLLYLPQNSGGASIPRNVGLDNATGEYIAFIDSDDLVSDDYIQKILDKTKENWDYCYISWNSDYGIAVIENEPPSWNCCVWNCIYKRELIGSERFNPIYKMAEDFDFNKRVRKGIRANITDCLYHYNVNNPYSLTKSGQIYNDKYR